METEKARGRSMLIIIEPSPPSAQRMRSPPSRIAPLRSTRPHARPTQDVRAKEKEKEEAKRAAKKEKAAKKAQFEVRS